MVFAGNPGTGKTTVARIIANLLKALGVLRKGHLVEADRSSLVAGYSGQTALKTKAVVNEALGGVLFVDEAYALVSGDRDAFGKEALDTLMKEMEDHRSDLVVIAAGYNDEMRDLLAANPGMESRFPTTLRFADYDARELMKIADSLRSVLQGFSLGDIDSAQGLRQLLPAHLQSCNGLDLQIIKACCVLQHRGITPAGNIGNNGGNRFINASAIHLFPGGESRERGIKVRIGSIELSHVNPLARPPRGHPPRR